jgi:hypothetical protein
VTKLVDVQPEHIELVWPRVRHWIESAVSETRYFTEDALVDLIKSRHAQLWLGWEYDHPIAVCITQLGMSPKGKYCSILIMLGEQMEKWSPLIIELEKWAAREGCSFMRHEARPGWARVLKKHGYEMPHVILEKGL